LPSNATNKTVSWSSGNALVATVDATGLVTGVAAGSATITVTTQDGGKIATSAISVSTNNGAYLGYISKGASSDGGVAGDMKASMFTAGSSFTANSMYVSLPNAVNGKIKGAIYSDNNGNPGSRLGITSEITNPTAGGFKKLTGLNVPIKRGTKYWLVVWGSAPFSVDCEISGGILKWKSRTYGSWPTTFPAPNGSSVLKYSIYVDGLKSAYLYDSSFLNDSDKVTNTEIITHNQLMVFPNPASKGVIYITLISVNESANLKIIDLTGRLIYNNTFMNFGGTQQLDISGLKKGIYLVYVRQGDAIYNNKLIVE